MRCIRVLALVTALIGVAFVTGTHADQWDKTTKVTFSEAVQVPGTILQPGTYTFKLLDSDSNRHIVQVFNEDGTQLITTVLAIPNYQLEPSGRTIMAFDERPLNQPVALKAWFYPGDNFGQEFVYSPSQMQALAQASYTEAPAPVEQPAAAAAPAETAPPAETPAPAPQPEAAAPPAEQPAPQPAPAPAAELPKTASDVPLIGFAGLVALGGALALRGFGKQKQDS